MPQRDRLDFFDEIEANKRKSILLIGVMFIISFFAMAFFLYLFMPLYLAFFLSFIISSAYIYFSYKSGMKVILSISKANEADRNKYPYLYNVVEGLSIAVGIKMPKIYIMEEESPNAFATGRSPENSAIVVTSGLLKILNQRELSAVLSHEISHIANYDVRYMLIAVVVVGFISLVSNLFAHSFLFSRGRSKKGGVLLIIGIIFMVLSPIIAELVKLAISRKREYLADANGARITRDPLGLASALEKISKTNIPVKNANKTTSALYFSNPLKSSGLFSTHPPISKRIDKLKRM